MGGRSDLSGSGGTKLDHQRHGAVETLVYEIFFIFQILAQLIEHLATLSLRRVPCKDKVNIYPVYNCFIFEKTTFYLK